MKRKKKKDVILQREQPQTQMYSVSWTLPPEKEKALRASAADTNVFLSQQLNENLLIMVNRGVYMSL